MGSKEAASWASDWHRLSRVSGRPCLEADPGNVCLQCTGSTIELLHFQAERPRLGKEMASLHPQGVGESLGSGHFQAVSFFAGRIQAHTEASGFLPLKFMFPHRPNCPEEQWERINFPTSCNPKEHDPSTTLPSPALSPPLCPPIPPASSPSQCRLF